MSSLICKLMFLWISGFFVVSEMDLLARSSVVRFPSFMHTSNINAPWKEERKETYPQQFILLIWISSRGIILRYNISRFFFFFFLHHHNSSTPARIRPSKGYLSSSPIRIIAQTRLRGCAAPIQHHDRRNCTSNPSTNRTTTIYSFFSPLFAPTSAPPTNRRPPPPLLQRHPLTSPRQNLPQNRIVPIFILVIDFDMPIPEEKKMSTPQPFPSTRFKKRTFGDYPASDTDVPDRDRTDTRTRGSRARGRGGSFRFCA